MEALVIIIFLIVVVTCVYLVSNYKKSYSTKLHLSEEEKKELQIKIDEQEQLIANRLKENEKFEGEKKKIEEKNKKMMLMSQTVYGEKRKVDEQLELLKVEKEKLEVDKKKVEEKVKKLWSASMAVQKEKEKINEIRKEVEHKHKEIVDSVHYAQRIQSAILPHLHEIETAFPNSFLLFKPKDVVSGDFYWFTEKENKYYIAAADCTGHGVPGAFMSMLGSDKLNDAIIHKNDVSDILSWVNVGVKKALRQSGSDDSTRDGMDVAILSFNKEMTLMEYAAANRPLWIVRNDGTEIEEIKATKVAIGGLTENNQEFAKNSLTLQKGDTYYIFTDGYADQFSSNDKKLMTRKFKEVLLEIKHLPMPEQGQHLDNFIENWKGGAEQTDDILVVGIRV